MHIMMSWCLTFNAFLTKIPFLAVHLYPCMKGATDVQNVLGDVVALKPFIVEVVNVQKDLGSQRKLHLDRASIDHVIPDCNRV